MSDQTRNEIEAALDGVAPHRRDFLRSLLMAGAVALTLPASSLLADEAEGTGKGKKGKGKKGKGGDGDGDGGKGKGKGKGDGNLSQTLRRPGTAGGDRKGKCDGRVGKGKSQGRV